MLFILALLAASGLVAPDRSLAAGGFGISLAMIAAGQFASAVRPGRLERALSLLTIAQGGALAALLYLGVAEPATRAILGIASATAAVAAVFAMAMAHRSALPMSVRLGRFLAPGYLVIAASTGLLLAQAVLAAIDAGGDALRLIGFGAIVALAATMRVKLAYWSVLDTATSSNAPQGADVDRVASRPAIAARRIVLAGMFLPAALTLLGLMSPSLMAVAAVLAALLGLAGAALERRLLFAEFLRPGLRRTAFTAKLAA